MYARVTTFIPNLPFPKEISVEATITNGLPMTKIYGLSQGTSRALKDKLLSALKISGFKIPPRKVTVNLSSEISKECSFHEFPIAVAVLIASKQIKLDKAVYAFGSLSLNGEVVKTKGVYSFLEGISDSNQPGCTIFLNGDTAQAKILFPELIITPIRKLTELTSLGRTQPIVTKPSLPTQVRTIPPIDVPETLKRVLKIAMTGRHSLLIIGPPGSGKTTLARNLVNTLPRPDIEEIRHISKRSERNMTPLLKHKRPLIELNPVQLRSLKGLELEQIIYSAGGVLLLDELFEIGRISLQSVMQPLDSNHVYFKDGGVLSVDMQMIATANPCRCGYHSIDENRCKCSAYQIVQYQQRLSKPFLDRIDLIIKLTNQESSSMKKLKVHKLIPLENRLNFHREVTDLIDKMTDKARFYIDSAKEKGIFSLRDMERIVRLAFTISKIEKSGRINSNHILEAITLRQANREI